MLTGLLPTMQVYCLLERRVDVKLGAFLPYPNATAVAGGATAKGGLKWLQQT